ncbi:MAG: hypothetical protein WCP34_03700 [Pseudomonadota bacterium]
MSEHPKIPTMIRVIGKAWADEAFKAALISDPVATIKAEGIPLPEGITISVVVQPTCQVYVALPPKSSEGKMTVEPIRMDGQEFPHMGQVMVKAWMDEAFQTALISDPIATIKAEGIPVPEGVAVSVIVNPSCQVWVMLPPKPVSA